MVVRRFRVFSAVVSVGAVIALSACGESSSKAAAPATTPTQAAVGAQAAADAASQLDMIAGTAKSNNATAGQGDWAMANGGAPSPAQAQAAEQWVQLTAGQAGNLKPVVINGAHLTLYRFDNDKPGVSTCYDACAVKWPPVLVKPGGKVFIAGIKPADVGFTKRNDGTIQITVKQHPVYRFAQDKQPGDTKGEGVGGTWFGVQPDGDKALDSSSGNQAPQVVVSGDPSGAGAAPATRAVFFDAKGFADNGSQAVAEQAGNTCSDLPRPGVASSVAVQGSIKLWQGPGCTGKSTIIFGDISDLSAIGFDKAVSSVRFLG